MSLYKIVRSKPYKNFMAKLYGIGASIVIAGALFKILHWPGADYMLMVGMLTESVIFFFSAFEPLHKDYDWALVYPELDVKKGEYQGPVTHQLDRMLEQANIDSQLIESLAAGMRNLSDNTKKLSNTADAALATEGYVANISKAKDAVLNLADVYEKSATELSATSDTQVKNIQEMFEAQKQHAQKMQEVQVQNAQKIGQIQEQGNSSIMENYKKIGQLQDQENLNIIENYKKLGEIQDKGNQSIVENYKKLGQIQDQGHQTIIQNYQKLQDSAAALVNSMNESVQEAKSYRQEVDKLSHSVAQINAIYANMLAAMTNK